MPWTELHHDVALDLFAGELLELCRSGQTRVDDPERSQKCRDRRGLCGHEEYAGAEALEKLPVLIKLEEGVEIGARAAPTAAIEDPDRLAVTVDVDPTDWTPLPPFRQRSPIADRPVWIGAVVDRLNSAFLCIDLSCGKGNEYDDRREKRHPFNTKKGIGLCLK